MLRTHRVDTLQRDPHHMTRLRFRSAALIGAAAFSLTGLVTPANAALPADSRPGCADGETSASARGGFGDQDHRPVSAADQRAIAARTDRILDRKGITKAEARKQVAGTTIPVYVHVMRDAAGNGDVTESQIAQQISVLNTTFGGGESATAANTGFNFSLAGTFRYNDNAWHRDRQSATYRSLTRMGGPNALNMWLVDFKYLGIATFPWDYSSRPSIDGIRVHYDSLPGGSIANYNLGETATHEAGHWLGLFHTFQGGCTEINDEVADTPAQSSPTNGCPTGRDSCPLPGLDPIHNYMDYSYDSCYTEFTGGQSTRMAQMYAAYRT